MMRNQRNRISRKKPELLLDDIYNSDDPAITEYQSKKLAAGVNVEHLAIYVAWKFKHLLSPQMQKILEAQHPRPENV